MKFLFLFFFITLLVFFSATFITADEIEWMEVSKENNELILIDPYSIKYSNSGILSAITKYFEVGPDDKHFVKSDSFLMAIDCDNRLFRKLPIKGDVNQIKSWNKPINDKLIKKAIINSCSY